MFFRLERYSPTAGVRKSQFTADSKLHCPDCDTDVHVGTGRISNSNGTREYAEKMRRLKHGPAKEREINLEL